MKMVPVVLAQTISNISDILIAENASFLNFD